MINEISKQSVEQLINEFSKSKKQGLSNLKDLLEEYSSRKVNFILNNRNASYDFNIFNLLTLKETQHSLFLGSLLNPNAAHGQGGLFLNSFLNLIGIETAELGKWIVTVEKGRVDILLRRRNPYSVVIVENKSNDADDQPNQLYRYWYQEIFTVSNANIEKVEPQSLAIVYLISDSRKVLNDNSMMKPVGWPDYLPDKVPIEPVILQFNREVINWLSNMLGALHGNGRMIELIMQYIEYWEIR